MTSSATRSSYLDRGLAGATFLLILALFFPTLREIALICWNDDDYSHGLLLPFVAAYMVWDQREIISEKLRRAQERPDAEKRETRWILPLLLLLGGLFLFFVGAASGISYASWFAFFPTTVAALYLIFGHTAGLILAPPVLLIFMAKPLPDSLVVRVFWPLQVFAAKVSARSLELFDVPVALTGNIIEIPAMKLLVEEACSGMRSVMALVTLSLIVIYFIELRAVSKFALVMISVCVAVVLNICRVAMTGFLAHFFDPATASGFFHTFSGLIVFIVALPILYFFGIVLTKIDQRFLPKSAEQAN